MPLIRSGGVPTGGAAFLLLLSAAGCDLGAGLRGPPPAGAEAPAVLPASGPRGDEMLSALAAGDGGAAHSLILRDSRGDGEYDRVLHLAHGPGGASVPTPVDGGPLRVASGRIAVDGEGAVHVAWIEATGSPRRLDAVVHRVMVDGAWSVPDTLYREPSRFGLSPPFVALGVDPAGDLHLLHGRTDRGFAHRVRRGGGWAVAEREASGGYVRWGEGDLAGRELVYVASDLVPGEMSASSDVWYLAQGGDAPSAPVRVHRDDAYAHEPQLAADGAGVRHVVWRAGPRPPHADRILHATSRDGRRWSEPRVAAAAASVYAPRLARDAAGRLHLFYSAASEGTRGHYRVPLDGSAPPAPLLAEEAAPASPLEAAPGPDGRVHVAWKGADGRWRHALVRP